MKTAGVVASVLVTAFLVGCSSTGTAGTSGDGARYKAVAGQGGVYDLQFPPDMPVAAMRNGGADPQDPGNPGGGGSGPDWNPGADYLKKPGRHYGMQAN